MKTTYKDITAYVTKDGSIIRELMHPAVHGNRNQSLAEAVVEPGLSTHRHRHRMTEELYHVTEGSGSVFLDEVEIPVGTGDTVLIPPGTPHWINNPGEMPLRILCCCSPPYSHEDTELV